MTVSRLCYFFIITSLVLSAGSCDLLSSDQNDSPPLEPVESSNNNGSVEEVVGPTWTLEEFQTSDGNIRNIEHKEFYVIEFRAESNALRGETFRNEFSGSYSIQNSSKINLTIKVYSDAMCSEFCRNYPWKIADKVDRYQVSDEQLKLGFGKQGVILFSKE